MTIKHVGMTAVLVALILGALQTAVAFTQVIGG